MTVVFDTILVENFCESCRAEMEWQSWEYGETCGCPYERDEYECPQVQMKFFEDEMEFFEEE